jgi:hypothetical protein
MANWALVENDKVKELHDNLPKSWKNFSGLRLSVNDTDFLKSLGWYSIVKDHQEYDNTLYREIGLNHVFEKNTVIETLILIEKELESSFEELKQIFMVELRRERNQRLVDSDWTQLNDVVSSMSEDDRNTWFVYRQMLRDLPKVYEKNEVLNIEEIEWPYADLSIVFRNENSEE